MANLYVFHQGEFFKTLTQGSFGCLSMAQTGPQNGEFGEVYYLCRKHPRLYPGPVVLLSSTRASTKISTCPRPVQTDSFGTRIPATGQTGGQTRKFRT